MIQIQKAADSLVELLECRIHSLNKSRLRDSISLLRRISRHEVADPEKELGKVIESLREIRDSENLPSREWRILAGVLDELRNQRRKWPTRA